MTATAPRFGPSPRPRCCSPRSRCSLGSAVRPAAGRREPRVGARRADRERPAGRGGGRHRPQGGHAHLLRAGRHGRRLDPGPRPERQTRRHGRAAATCAAAAPSRYGVASAAPDCPTAPTPWPGRPSPPTATRSPAPSPSPSARPPRPPSSLPDQKAGGGLVGVALRHRALRRVRRLRRCSSAARPSCSPAGSAGAGVRPLQRLVVRGWVTLTAATLAMLLLRTPYTGSGKLADAFDLDGLQAVLDTKTGAALVSRLLLLGAAALFIAVLFGAYAEARRTRRRRKDLTFGLAIGGAVVAGGDRRRPGRWPSTPRRASSRASRCRSTSCTCWPSPPGSAGSPRCWSRSTGAGRSSGRRYGGSPSVAFGSVRRARGDRDLPVLAAGRLLVRADRHLVRAAAADQGGAGRRAGRRRLDLAAVDGAARGRARTEATAKLAPRTADEERHGRAHGGGRTGCRGRCRGPRAAPPRLARQEAARRAARPAEEAPGTRPGTPTRRAPDCAAPYWRRRASRWSCWPSTTDPDVHRAGPYRGGGRQRLEHQAADGRAGPAAIDDQRCPSTPAAGTARGPSGSDLDPAASGANVMHVWIDGPSRKPMDVARGEGRLHPQGQGHRPAAGRARPHRHGTLERDAASRSRWPATGGSR